MSIKHTLTQEDLDGNPELGLAVGDTLELKTPSEVAAELAAAQEKMEDAVEAAE